MYAVDKALLNKSKDYHFNEFFVWQESLLITKNYWALPRRSL